MKRLYLLPLLALLVFCSCNNDCEYSTEYSYIKIGGAEAVGIKKFCFSSYRDSLERKPATITMLSDFFRANPELRKLSGPELLMSYGSITERSRGYFARPYLFWFDENNNIVCVWDLRRDSPDSNARWRDPQQWRVDSMEVIACKGEGDYVGTIYNNIFVFDSSDITN